VWTQTLLLGFLTGRPLPMVPDPLRAAWARWDARVRDSALELLTQRVVRSRATVLGACYPARLLATVVTRVARDTLDGRAAPARAGQAWVPPQLRWAHEADRAGWLRCASEVSQAGTPALDGIPGLADSPSARFGAFGPVPGWELAPPLDFALAGLPDWPGIRVADRLALLLRHPLALSDPGNRELAGTALLGTDGQHDFHADVAAVTGSAVPLAPHYGPAGIPSGPAASIALLRAARMMDLPGDWLVTVLRWAISR
jgi:hypothetical protein